MLKGNPNVFPYTTFATADKLFEKHPIWQQARIIEERKLIFEEYVAELRQQEMVRTTWFCYNHILILRQQQEQRASHARAISKVVSLFKDLQVDVLTKWRQAHQRLLDSPQWAADPELRQLPSLDILLAFEDFARVQEREFEEQMRRQQVDKTRRERRAREAFKGLLKELVDAGSIKARTKWKTVYPEFKEDERYLNMLGQAGSNPLELFWDVVDSLDQQLDAKIAVVEDALHKRPAGADGEHFAVTPETTLQKFLAVLKDDKEVRSLSEADLKTVFKTVCGSHYSAKRWLIYVLCIRCIMTQ
jgi:pre-mRNA-processing factor 40